MIIYTRKMQVILVYITLVSIVSCLGSLENGYQSMSRVSVHMMHVNEEAAVAAGYRLSLTESLRSAVHRASSSTGFLTVRSLWGGCSQSEHRTKVSESHIMSRPYQASHFRRLLMFWSRCSVV